MNDTVVKLVKKVVSTYNIFLIIIGTLTSSLTIITCLQKDLRVISTFKLYAFKAVSDTISLYPWNIRQFILYFFGMDLEKTFLWWCIGANYIQFTTFEISAWLLLTISADRIMAILVKKWNKLYFYGKRITIYVLCLAAALFSYNIYFSLDNGYISKENGTETIFCNKPKSGDYLILKIGSMSFLFLFSILPFTLLIIFNSLIIKTVISSRKNMSQSISKQRKMAFTVLSISFLFIICSLPTASIQGETIGYLLSFDVGQLIVTCCNSLVFTYQASNFWILSFTNARFKSAFMKMIGLSKHTSSRANPNSNSTLKTENALRIQSSNRHNSNPNT